MSLELGNGAVIDDPLGEALEFIARDGTYQGYDAQPSDPDHLTPEDIHLANRIIARMGPRDAATLLGRAPEVDQALAAIPHDATLVEDVDWPALQDLFVAVDGLAGIGLARATKVLHKKRPALIPILDEVVVRYLGASEPGTIPERAVRQTHAYQRELHHCLPVLSQVRSELAARGYELTECRILDIYLWAASGTYEPLWKRRPSTPTTPRVPAPRARSTDPWGRLPEELARFTHDDTGYLRWLAANPRGCVLNCAHQPRADYLKLHRTDCPHLRRAGMTNLTGAYTKVCGPSATAINKWLQATLATTADRCPVCFH